MSHGRANGLPEAGPNVEIVSMTIHVAGKAVELPLERVLAHGPGLVVVKDPDSDEQTHYIGFPLIVRARPSAVLAPGGPRIHRGA